MQPTSIYSAFGAFGISTLFLETVSWGVNEESTKRVSLCPGQPANILSDSAPCLHIYEQYWYTVLSFFDYVPGTLSLTVLVTMKFKSGVALHWLML